MASDVQKSITECRDILSDLRKSMEDSWRVQAGNLADSMINDVEAARRGLSHEDSNIRNVALSILATNLEMRSNLQFTQTCERMALFENDAAVRSNACACLGLCFTNTHDLRIASLLSKVVVSTVESVNARYVAYVSLLMVMGRFDEWKSRAITFQFPEEVDWNIVQTYSQS